MPDTTVLEVRGPSSPQARTLELGAPSVRIGRGPQCEVRLGEPSLAEVQCLLRRRGDTWHVQPVGPPGHLSIQGRPVESQRPLPPGEPMRVGDHWLMLSHLRDEDRERTLTVSASPASSVPSRSVEPSGSSRPTASKPPRAPSSRLVSPRPEDCRWEDRPLGDRPRRPMTRPAGSSVPRNAREAGAPIRPVPTPPYESRLLPSSYPLPPGSHPEPTTTPATARIPVVEQSPAPAPPAPTPVLGRATIVRDEPPSVPVGPASTMASLPGLEAWAAELLEQARASYPPASAFPLVPLAEPPTVVELIEPETGPSLDPIATAPPIDPRPEPEAFEDGFPSHSPASESLWSTRGEPADPAVDRPSVTETDAAHAPPTPRIAITFEQPPTGLHRYLASVRQRRRSTPADPMARTVESLPAVPVEPEEVEADVVEERRDADPGPTPTPIALDPGPAPAEGSERLEVLGDPVDEVEPLAIAELPAIAVPEVEHPTVVQAPPESPIGPVRDWSEIGSRGPAVAPMPELPEVPPTVAGDWPTARSILDSAARLRAVEPSRPTSAARRSSIALPTPTVATPPSRWELPGWLVAPALLATLALGGVGLWLSACQAEGLMAVGPLADRAASRRPPTTGDLLLAAAPTRLVTTPAWWNSPAEASWPRAWALDDGVGGDPARTEAVREWLDRARATAPALPAVRYALVGHANADDRDRTERWPVGMGRDVLSRAMLGRRLLDEGKTEAGFAAYREALDLARRAQELDLPAFDDKETRRYRLHGEDLVERVASDLAKRSDFHLSDWLELLGDHHLPMLVAGRSLKARGNLDGDRLLEKAAEPLVEEADAWEFAARAEALALLSRHDAAESGYQEALERLPEGQSRRILLHNLADVRRRRGDEAAARSSLKTACGDQVDDPIGRRALRVIAEIDRARRGSSLAEGSRKPSAPSR